MDFDDQKKIRLNISNYLDEESFWFPWSISVHGMNITDNPEGKAIPSHIVKKKMNESNPNQLRSLMVTANP